MARDESTRRLIQKVLGDPALIREYAPEFLAMIQQTVTQDPNLEIDGYQISPGAVKDRNVALDAEIGQYKTKRLVGGSGLVGGTLAIDRPTLGQEPDFYELSGNGTTYTLPKADTVPGKVFTFKAVNANANTIACFAGDTIEGAATVVLNALYQTITIVSGATAHGDGTVLWYYIQRLDGPGQSLGLLVPGTPRQMAFGSATITWAGGTPVGGTAVITHGFSSQPWMSATSTTTNGGLATATYISAATATTTTVNAYAQGGSPPAGNVATVYWIAIN